VNGSSPALQLVSDLSKYFSNSDAST
jgi:hypothetical protein